VSGVRREYPATLTAKLVTHLYVNYYRCLACGHVWTVDKNNPSNVQHVTPLPPPKQS